MAEYGTAHASGKTGFFNKCYLIILLALLVSIAAIFLFFAVARQTHPASSPAQKSEQVHRLLLEPNVFSSAV